MPTVTKGRTESLLDVESHLHQIEDQLCGVVFVKSDLETNELIVDDLLLLSDIPEEKRPQWIAFWRAVAIRADAALRTIPG